MQKGFSREVLGSMAGITGKQVGLIERGVARHSRAETMVSLAYALETDVLSLFPHRGRP